MKLKELIKKLTKHHAEFVTSHGIEPDIFGIEDDDDGDWYDKVVEIGAVSKKPGHRSCSKQTYKKIKVRI